MAKEENVAQMICSSGTHLVAVMGFHDSASVLGEFGVALRGYKHFWCPFCEAGLAMPSVLVLFQVIDLLHLSGRSRSTG